MQLHGIKLIVQYLQCSGNYAKLGLMCHLLTWSVILHQDYQEEISVAQENKQQLQVMGERLARASQDNKAAEIQHKLTKVSERWQHLLDLIAARWVHKTLTGGECCLILELVWSL